MPGPVGMLAPTWLPAQVTVSRLFEQQRVDEVSVPTCADEFLMTSANLPTALSEEAAGVAQGFHLREWVIGCLFGGECVDGVDWQF